MHDAADSGHVNIIEKLVQSGADVNGVRKVKVAAGVTENKYVASYPVSIVNFHTKFSTKLLVQN